MNNFERTQPKYSIIIPSWFTENQHGKYGKNETFWFAQECLKKLLERTPKNLFELIIIDNGSSLDLDYNHISDGWLSTNEYWMTTDILIHNKTNLGFTPACNQGFKVARGEYIVLMNNDVIIWTGWLEALTEVYNKGLTPPVGVVMPALVKQTRDAREALKMEEIDLTTNKDKYGRGAEFGSLWMIKKELLDKLKDKDGNVFDENFKCGMGEDRDLWDRVRILGYETYRTHNTRVFHQGNMSIGKVPNRKVYTLPNREYLARKRKSRQQKT